MIVVPQTGTGPRAVQSVGTPPQQLSMTESGRDACTVTSTCFSLYLIQAHCEPRPSSIETENILRFPLFGLSALRPLRLTCIPCLLTRIPRLKRPTNSSGSL